MFFENVGVLLHAFVATEEDDAFLGERILDVVVGHLAVDLGAETAEKLLLFLGDPELVIGAANLLRHVLPLVGRFVDRAHVVGDRVVIDVAQARHPGRQVLLEKYVEAAMPELAHPVRLALHVAHVIDDGMRWPLRHVVDGLEVVVEPLFVGSRQNLIG